MEDKNITRDNRELKTERKGINRPEALGAETAGLTQHKKSLLTKIGFFHRHKISKKPDIITLHRDWTLIFWVSVIAMILIVIGVVLLTLSINSDEIYVIDEDTMIKTERINEQILFDALSQFKKRRTEFEAFLINPPSIPDPAL